MKKDANFFKHAKKDHSLEAEHALIRV